MDKTKRTLVIPDTHAPFEHKDFLKHCKQVAKYFKINDVKHAGDILDNHAISYHEHDVNGDSAGAELEYAIEHLAEWHAAFKNVQVVLGNHDRLVWRKLKTAGLPQKWAAKLTDVLQLPTWSFHTSIVDNNVLYVHGEGGTAKKVAERHGMSVVQGHRHTEAYVWHLAQVKPIWAMQVGCGIDAEAYAMDYAKNFAPPVLACGVVLDGGKLPILMPMQ